MAEPTTQVIRPLVRPHDDHHYFPADRQAETNSLNFDRRGTLFAPILMQFEAEGSAIAVGPVRPALRSRGELLHSR